MGYPCGRNDANEEQVSLNVNGERAGGVFFMIHTVEGAVWQRGSATFNQASRVSLRKLSRLIGHRGAVVFVSGVGTPRCLACSYVVESTATAAAFLPALLCSSGATPRYGPRVRNAETLCGLVWKRSTRGEPHRTGLSTC